MGNEIILLLVGFFFALFPGMIWFFSIGWLFKDAEPSDIVIKVIRYFGIFIVVIAIILILDRFVLLG
jgi:hypothetical protein